MAIGIPAAIGGASYIQSQLFGLKPADASTLVFACLLLTRWPCWRAICRRIAPRWWTPWRPFAMSD